MEIYYCDDFYHTRHFQDNKAGCEGLELHCTAKNETQAVAKITFWDASGQFFIETSASEIPLEVMEKFICETKSLVIVS